MDSVALCSATGTPGSRTVVARPRSRRERTEGRSLDGAARGGMAWTSPGRGSLAEAWRRSSCPDLYGDDTLPVGIEAELHASHEIVIGAHRRVNGRYRRQDLKPYMTGMPEANLAILLNTEDALRTIV